MILLRVASCALDVSQRVLQPAIATAYSKATIICCRGEITNSIPRRREIRGIRSFQIYPSDISVFYNRLSRLECMRNASVERSRLCGFRVLVNLSRVLTYLKSQMNE